MRSLGAPPLPAPSPPPAAVPGPSGGPPGGLPVRPRPPAWAPGPGRVRADSSRDPWPPSVLCTAAVSSSGMRPHRRRHWLVQAAFSVVGSWRWSARRFQPHGGRGSAAVPVVPVPSALAGPPLRGPALPSRRTRPDQTCHVHSSPEPGSRLPALSLTPSGQEPELAGTVLFGDGTRPGREAGPRGTSGDPAPDSLRVTERPSQRSSEKQEGARGAGRGVGVLVGEAPTRGPRPPSRSWEAAGRSPSQRGTRP